MYKFYIKSMLIALAVGATSLYSAPVTFNSGGGLQTTTVFLNGSVDAPNILAGLTSQATFSLLDIVDSGKRWNFEVTVAETGSVNARVSALGFVNIIPDVNGGGVTSHGGTEWEHFNFTGSNIKFPNEFGDLEGCLIGNDNSCNGGGGSGVANNSSATILFYLTFASAPELVRFEGFGVRYQSIETDNIRGGSGTGSDTGTDPNTPPLENPVPEPATMGLMGLSLAALAAAYRRRK